MYRLGLLVLLGLTACDEQQLGYPEQQDTGTELRIWPGMKVWGRIDGSFVGGMCIYWPPDFSSVSVSDGSCDFTMAAESCECLDRDQAKALGVTPGVWCYGTVTGIDFGDGDNCLGSTGPSWGPPH